MFNSKMIGTNNQETAIGLSAVFNNVDSRITTTSAACVTGNGARTASVWVNTTQIPGNETLLNYGSSSNNSQWWWYIGNNVMQLRAYFNDFSFDATSYNIFDGNWHHLAVTHNGSVLKFYIDGTEAVSSSRSYNTNASTLEIGREGTNFYGGKMDDYRFYSRALSGTEIGYIASNDQANIPNDSLKFHYKFDGDTLDSSPNNYNGNPTNITYAPGIV